MNFVHDVSVKVRIELTLRDSMQYSSSDAIDLADEMTCSIAQSVLNSTAWY